MGIFRTPRGFGWFTNPRRALKNRIDYRKRKYGLIGLLNMIGTSRGRKSEVEEPEPKGFSCLGCLVLPFLGILVCAGLGSLIPRSQTIESNPVASKPAHVDTVVSVKPETKLPADVVERIAPEPEPVRTPPGSLRTWSTADGKHKTEAAYIGLVANKVELEKSDGKQITVPLDKLSAADIGWLRKQNPYGIYELYGEAFTIADGDTFTLTDADKKHHRIRLQGIDSPEDGQAFGTDCRKALATAIFKKQIRVTWSERDKYARILGHVYLNDEWINRRLIEQGYAWHFKKYDSDSALATAEIGARRARLGLCRDKTPIPPWDYRASPRESKARPLASSLDQPSRLLSRGESTAKQTVYVTKSGTKYHRAGCRHLRKSSIPMDLEDARGSYLPCGTCNPPR